MQPATITIGIDPTIELGPVTLAWHGLTIAIGILVGGRLYYLMEHGHLLEPSEWVGTRGFTFYGGFTAAALGIAVFIWRRRLSVSYLDAIAVGLPLGLETAQWTSLFLMLVAAAGAWLSLRPRPGRHRERGP